MAQYEQALELLKDHRCLADLVLETLYWMIMILLTLKEFEQAKTYYRFLKIVSSAQSPNLPVEQVKKLIQVIMYKELADNEASLKKTKETFLELLKEEPFSATYMLRTYIHLCDLLLHEMRHSRTHDPDTMKKLLAQLDKIIQMCFTVNEYLLGMEFMLLQARIHAFLHQETEALIVLSKALSIARSNGLNKILVRITIISDEIMEALRHSDEKDLNSDRSTESKLTIGQDLLSRIINDFNDLKLEIIGHEEFPSSMHARDLLFFIGGLSGFPLYMKIHDNDRYDDLRLISRRIASYISLNARNIRNSGRNIDLGLFK